MKIILLGGCADMATPILELIGKEEDVEKVTLADLDLKKAQNLARSLGDRYDAARLDANNHDEMVRLVGDYDVAMGYIGPFYHFEHRIAAACIEAGTNYVSISDDYDAYLHVIELDEKAREKGVTILSGLGNSPGLTNLLAKKGYQSMDTPKKIHIQWTGGSDEAVGPANVKHVMHIFEGKTLQWQNGKEVWVECGGGEKVVEFPEPIGIQTVFYTGHAESVSVPRNLPGLEEVTLHGGARPVWVARLATWFGKLGMTTTHAKRERLTKLLTPMMGLFQVGDSADKSVFRIDVYGEHEGHPRHHIYSGVGPIAEITSFPLLEGALKLGRGELDKAGVFAAEALLDPDEFLPRVVKRGVEMMYYEGEKAV